MPVMPNDAKPLSRQYRAGALVAIEHNDKQRVPRYFNGGDGFTLIIGEY